MSPARVPFWPLAFALTLMVACEPPLTEMPGAGRATESALLKTAASANLLYYGGPVIANVRVVKVLYGTGTFIPEAVGGNRSVDISSFYRDVTASPYLDWLSEYDTDVAGAGGVIGTGQHIGEGLFAGEVAITPDPANDGSVIPDANIRAELSRQIDLGTLPLPDANTLFMLYLPRGKNGALNGNTTCTNICAYHWTFSKNGTRVAYGVVADQGPGSGCDQFCGTGTYFQNETSISAHEMVEAITDPEIGLARGVASPAGWYDPAQGEIGDICQTQPRDIINAHGANYLVQREWSNRFGGCISVAPSPSNDFYLKAAPGAASASTCTTAQVSLPLSLTSGAPVSVALSTQLLPPGVTGTFDHDTVSSDGTATLTLSVSSSAALQGPTPFEVVATGGGQTHVTQVSLAIAAGPRQLYHLPVDQTVEATSPAGAVVNFTPPTVGSCQEASPASCAPASNSLFPLGTTLVTCTADDGSGHVVQGTFHVTVRDSSQHVVAEPGAGRVVGGCAAGGSPGDGAAWLLNFLLLRSARRRRTAS